MKKHGRRSARAPSTLLLGTSTLLALSVCALACRTPPRAGAQAPSGAKVGTSVPQSGAGLPVASARSRVEEPLAQATLDPEALPALLPEACPWGRGRNVPANQRAPVLQALRDAWPKVEPPTPSLGPVGCVESIKLSCAPNLDDAAGAEVLAEVQYRIYQADCASASAKQVSPTTAVVALSPSKSGSPAWGSRGLIGYRSFDALGIEGTSHIEGDIGFVRLPNGEAAVRLLVSTDGGDCSGRRVDHIVLLRDGAWSTVTSRTINECNQEPEPEDADSF